MWFGEVSTSVFESACLVGFRTAARGYSVAFGEGERDLQELLFQGYSTGPKVLVRAGLAQRGLA